MDKLIFSIVVLFCISCCGGCSSKESDTSYLTTPVEEQIDEEPEPVTDDGSIKIAYTEQMGNTFTIPVEINGMRLDMVFDTGASPTLITMAEAKYMFEKGHLQREDILNVELYEAANGQPVAGLRVNLRDVKIGEEIKLHDIEAIVVSNQKADLLLGQSVMKKFKEISVDMENKVVKFIKNSDGF
jgi:aspartyl protease family protein